MSSGVRPERRQEPKEDHEVVWMGHAGVGGLRPRREQACVTGNCTSALFLGQTFGGSEVTYVV